MSHHHRRKGSSADLTGKLMLLEADGTTWTPYHMVLRRNALSYHDADAPESESVGALSLLGSDAVAMTSKDSKRCIKVTSKAAGSSPVVLCATSADHEKWLEALSCACIPYTWPGGVDSSGRPRPLFMSKLAATPDMESPLLSYSDLSSVAAPLRKAQILRMLRTCSVVFDGPDPLSHSQLRDVKRDCLEKLLNHQLRDPNVFSSWRVLEDSMAMIRMNLLRSLPMRSTPMEGDDEDDMFMDPQWPHLAGVYEYLLQLVSSDVSTLHQKKKLIDSTFVRQLLLLFDSEDFRERDYLKNITHRIYSKLTQRRALIRRVIANVFFEFVYETDSHNGIGEMLEILASIINGFCVPIKDEHKVMLVRALIPLHKSPRVVMYHPQLSYCMILYVAKDHTLTREVVSGLLRYWPMGNSVKQNLFLNELEDLFEYVQQDDLEVFRDQLIFRLLKNIGGPHFQVAERTLCLWNSVRFSQLAVESAAGREIFLPPLFRVLYRNAHSHWHESVKVMCSNALSMYGDHAPELLKRLLDEEQAKEEQNGDSKAVEDKEVPSDDDDTAGRAAAGRGEPKTLGAAAPAPGGEGVSPPAK